MARYRKWLVEWNVHEMVQVVMQWYRLNTVKDCRCWSSGIRGHQQEAKDRRRDSDVTVQMSLRLSAPATCSRWCLLRWRRRFELQTLGNEWPYWGAGVIVQSVYIFQDHQCSIWEWKRYSVWGRRTLKPVIHNRKIWLLRVWRNRAHLPQNLGDAQSWFAATPFS